MNSGYQLLEICPKDLHVGSLRGWPLDLRAPTRSGHLSHTAASRLSDPGRHRASEIRRHPGTSPMLDSNARRDLSYQLRADPCGPSHSKMTPGSQQEADTGREGTDTGMEQSPHNASLPGHVAVSNHIADVTSLASTESLLERTLDELFLSPMGDIEGSPPPGDRFEHFCNNDHLFQDFVPGTGTNSHSHQPYRLTFTTWVPKFRP